MTLTLWRGDQLLGALVVRARSGDQRLKQRPTSPSLSAFLLPASTAVALEAVWQIAWPPDAGGGVQQHAIEPDNVADREQRHTTRDADAGPVELQLLSSDAAAGVSPDVQLTVRAEQGPVYLPRQIRLEEVRYEPALFDVAFREVPPDALINGSVWCAFIMFASDADAPDT